MAIPAMVLLQQHDARRDILIEPDARRRAAIEARGHSELRAQSGRKKATGLYSFIVAPEGLLLLRLNMFYIVFSIFLLCIYTSVLCNCEMKLSIAFVTLHISRNDLVADSESRQCFLFVVDFVRSLQVDDNECPPPLMTCRP